MVRGRKVRSTRASKDGGKKFVGVVLIAAVVGVLGSLLFLREEALQLDVEGCLVGAPTPSLLAILIDSTDEIADRTAREAKIKILKEIALLEDYSRIELYEMSQQGNHITALFSRCKPPTGDGADLLTQNERLMRIRFAEFETIFSSALAGLLDKKSSSESPILESIQSVAVEISSVDTPARRIIVLSDLIQHSSRVSFYRSKPAIENYVARQREIGGGFADLRGTSIRFMVVPRELSTGSKLDLKKFWMDWIDFGEVKESGSSIEDLS